MKLEDQVCQHYLSKKLTELGLKKESVFSWVDQNHEIKLTSTIMAKLMISRPKDIRLYEENNIFPAYSVAELGEMIPHGVNTVKDGLGWYTEVFKPLKEWNKLFPCRLEANARANILINLIETGIVKVEDLNK